MAELSYIGEMSDEDRRISEAVVREQGRLRNFVRKYVSDQSDVEDILQDVFYEFVAAFRMLRPVEHATAWLFRVARNRIIDRFRGKTRDVLRNAPAALPGEGALDLDELLPSPDAGPEAAYVRSVLLEEIDDALLELPEEQREVFIGHELLGYSFQEMAEETGVSVNTLLSRKRYAVLHLRRRLRAIHEEFKKS
jgi:RNA polymerase sigma factor (sigma-70 family)